MDIKLLNVKNSELITEIETEYVPVEGDCIWLDASTENPVCVKVDSVVLYTKPYKPGKRKLEVTLLVEYSIGG